MLSEGTSLERSSNALHRIIDGKAVILHAETGEYLTLNAVASRVWQLLEKPASPASLRRALLREFDVVPDALARDIETFLTELETAGLVRRVT